MQSVYSTSVTYFESVGFTWSIFVYGTRVRVVDMRIAKLVIDRQASERKREPSAVLPHLVETFNLPSLAIEIDPLSVAQKFNTGALIAPDPPTQAR